MTKEHVPVATLQVDLGELNKLPEEKREKVMKDSFKDQIRPVIELHSDVEANSKEAFEAWSAVYNNPKRVISQRVLKAGERIKSVIARIEGHGAFIKELRFREGKAHLQLQNKSWSFDANTGYIQFTPEEKKELRKTKKLISLLTKGEPTIQSLLEKEYILKRSVSNQVMTVSVFKIVTEKIIKPPVIIT